MTLPEVETLLQRLNEQKCEGAYLQAIKPLGWRPSGFKFKTPFGLAHLLNVIDRDNHTSVTFMIETAKIQKWLKREKKKAEYPSDTRP